MLLSLIVVCILLLITNATAFRNGNSYNIGRRQGQVQQQNIHSNQHLSHDHYHALYQRFQRIKTIRYSPLYLVPISSFNDEVSVLSLANKESRFPSIIFDADGTIVLDNKSYELSFMEESDIGNIAQFIVRIFGGDAINLSQNLTSVERLILSPAVDVVNGYSSLVAFAEVYAGLRSRLSHRFQSNHDTDLISPPKLHGLSREEQIQMISSTSIVIVLATKESQSNEDRSTTSSTANNPNIIATVELRLQPCDAKIPFTLPWIDRIERKLFSSSSNGMKQQQPNDLQPYLSNLCVDEIYRGRGIGKLLVHCVETIANTYWGYHHMYLHVDLENVAAVQLYKKQGYTDVGRRWNPFWAGKAADIGYFVKNLKHN